YRSLPVSLLHCTPSLRVSHGVHSIPKNAERRGEFLDRSTLDYLRDNCCFLTSALWFERRSERWDAEGDGLEAQPTSNSAHMTNNLPSESSQSSSSSNSSSSSMSSSSSRSRISCTSSPLYSASTR